MLHKSLDNGLEVLVNESRFVHLVAVQCWVGAGSLNEEDGERGMAHMIEHMLFKGTEKRGVGEISARIEGRGGDLNAYTTFDQTVFHLTIAPDAVDEGVELLADAIFHSAFAADELEREKEVVVEEILRSLDNPASLIGRQVFSAVYAGSEAARPIIGDEASVRAFTRDAILRFHRKWYHPENMRVVVTGDFDEREMLDCVERHFSQPARQPLAPAPVCVRQKLIGTGVRLIRGDYQLPRLEIGLQAPGMDDADAVALDLAAFTFGAGDGSRLSRRLRDEEGLVSAIGCSVYTPVFGGVFEISAFPKAECVRETVEAIARELTALKYRRDITGGDLQRARANLQADRIFQEETISGQARSLGYGLTTRHKEMLDDVYETLIQKMSLSRVWSALDRWLHEDNVVIAALLPEAGDHWPDEDELLAAWQAGVATARRDLQSLPVAAPEQVRKRSPWQPDVLTLENGSRFIYRRNRSVGLFSLVGASEGGLRAETRETAGLHHAVSSLLGAASEKHDYAAMLAAVEGRGASLEGFSGKDSWGFRTQGLAADFEGMLALWQEGFLTPRFPDQQWQTTRQEILETIRTEGDSPAGIAFRAFQQAVYQGHPYEYPVYGFADNTRARDPQSLLEAYAGMRDRSPWVFAAVGNLEAEKVADRLNEVLAGWQPGQGRPSFYEEPPASPDQVPGSRQFIPKDREQTHIVLGWKGLSWGDPDRPALDVLSTILGGSGGRLFLELRDRRSLAYSVAPVQSYGCNPGIFGTYIACAPDKQAEAVATLDQELQALCRTPPDNEELQRAINYLRGGHESDLQRCEAQAMTMALMEAYGFGYDDFLTWPERISRVTPEVLLETARRVMTEEGRRLVIVGPEDRA